MNDNYTVLTVFDYSTSAQVLKSKLESQDIKVMLMDEKTIDSDPLISQAIGGVKLLVHNSDLDRAIELYNEVREYQKDKYGHEIKCPNCASSNILIAAPKRSNIFYMLFPFFEKNRYICNLCKTIFI